MTMLKEDRNHSRKRQNQLKITGKKAINLSKKRVTIENLQEIPYGTSQKENLQNLSFVRISEQ
jgi:hypothetical protein